MSLDIFDWLAQQIVPVLLLMWLVAVLCLDGDVFSTFAGDSSAAARCAYCSSPVAGNNVCHRCGTPRR